MSSLLVARAAADGIYEWLRPGAGAASVERGDPHALAAAAQTRPIALVVDGRTVRVLEAHIPARSQRQAQQAAPYAIEEDVADDIEQLHIVCGAGAANGRRNVAVVRQRVLEELLAPLRAAGATIAYLTPEYLALPHRPGHWSLLREGDRVLVRTGDQQGFSCDLTFFDPVITQLAAHTPPVALDVFGDCPVPAALAGLPRHDHPLPAGPFGLIASGSDDPARIDILPAQYRTKQRGAGRGLRVAVLLLALAFVAHVGFLLNDIRHATAALATVRQTQAQTLQRAFPGITRIVNAEVQATQAVAELRGQQRQTLGALEMIHHIGRGMQGAGQPALALENLNYADGVASLRLSAPDIASLERYSEALKSTLAVEVMAVEARNEGVGGSLRIQPLPGEAR